jgi:hypothetical protein
MRKFPEPTPSIGEMAPISTRQHTESSGRAFRIRRRGALDRCGVPGRIDPEVAEIRW